MAVTELKEQLAHAEALKLQGTSREKHFHERYAAISEEVRTWPSGTELSQISTPCVCALAAGLQNMVIRIGMQV